MAKLPKENTGTKIRNTLTFVLTVLHLQHRGEQVKKEDVGEAIEAVEEIVKLTKEYDK